MQAEEEQQRPSSKGSSATAVAQLRAMQRRSDLYALELVLGPDDRQVAVCHEKQPECHTCLQIVGINE